MKATIIIPTRNRLRLLLERSLPSALDQTFRDFEVIIIDDCSEESPLIPPDPRVVLVKNSQRRGLAYARNLGAKMARGKYVVSLDDDNEFHADFLGKTVEFLDAHPEFAAVGVGKVVCYPEGRVYQQPPVGAFFAINDGFVMRREAFLTVQCDEELMANDDADLGLRFLKRFKVGSLDEPLMTVYASAVVNKTSNTDYSDVHLAGLAKFWLKDRLELPSEDYRHYRRYIGRMFLLASGQRWYRWGYIIEQKIKRYWQILW